MKFEFHVFDKSFWKNITRLLTFNKLHCYSPELHLFLNQDGHSLQKCRAPALMATHPLCHGSLCMFGVEKQTRGVQPLCRLSLSYSI